MEGVIYMLILFRIYLIIAIVIAVVAFYETLKRSEQEVLDNPWFIVGAGVGSTIGGATWPLITLLAIVYSYIHCGT